MAIYEFIQIERQDGPFEVPGEIVEVCDPQPHSKKQFTALVKISKDVLVEDENGEEEVDFASFDGVGTTVATRMKAAGYRFPSDLEGVDPEDLADEVKGLGPGRAEEIIENVTE